MVSVGGDGIRPPAGEGLRMPLPWGNKHPFQWEMCVGLRWPSWACPGCAAAAGGLFSPCQARSVAAASCSQNNSHCAWPGARASGGQGVQGCQACR